MLDISWGELVLVGMVALIVIGPKELPTVLRTAGQWMSKVRRMAAEFQGQFQEAMREAEFADLKKQVDSIGDSARNLTDFNPLDTAQKEFETALGDEPRNAASGAQAGSPGTGSPGTDSPGAGTPIATTPAEPATERPPAEPASAPPPAQAVGGSFPAPGVDGAQPASDAAKPPDLTGGRAA